MTGTLMRVTLRDLEPARFDGVPLTYAEVGATRDDRLPSGYRAVERTSRVGTGQAVFSRGAEALLGWRMHPRAGIRVTASSPVAVPNAVVVQRIGWGPLSLLAPCRVVYVVDTPTRRGFAYGTLLGHPECGEEAFILQLSDDGTVTFTVRAFSRPGTVLTRAAGPLTRAVQDVAINRYHRALASLARG